MSLYKRKDSPYWWVKLTHDGRSVSESTGTASKRQAQEYHDKRKAELWEQHRLGVKPRRIWDEAVLKYLNEVGAKRAAGATKYILRWMQPHLEGIDLAKIDREVVERLMQLGLGEGLSNATVNRRNRLLRAILRRAWLEWEWIDRVPKFRMLAESKGRTRFLTPADVQRLLAELPEHSRAMCRFDLSVGLRQANVKQLRWAQVDLKNRRAWVDAGEAKGGRAISIPLNAEAMQVLQEQLGRHPEFVFTYRGKPITQVNTKAWRAALKRAGIEDFTWHDLRHTWASWHIQNGTPENVLQKLGAWRSREIVQRYAHLSTEHLEGYADRFEERVGLRDLTRSYDLATLSEDANREGCVNH